MTPTPSTPSPHSAGPHSAGPHTAIYRRWRAQTFSQIVGQAAVVETLRNAVRLGRVGHAYLFVGPRGTGKTSMARILAKAVNCTALVDGEPCDACPSCVAIREGTALDVAEFDAASNNTVNDMRELLPRVHTAPADLRRKVFIVDEVQRIKEGWDVLLKTLEEPPPHVLFVFCTTDPTQIRPAVLSRVQRFNFRPLTVDEIVGKLDRILADDGRRADPDAVRLVAELAAGGMRDAESMLDQLLSTAAEVLTADGVRAQLGLAASGEVDALVTALLEGDVLAGIRVLDRLEAEGRDLRLAIDQAIDRLRRLLFARLASEPVPSPFASAPLAELVAAVRGLASLDTTRAGGGRQRVQLELLLLQRAAASPTVQPKPHPAPAVRPQEQVPAPHVPAPTAAPRAQAEPPASPVPGRASVASRREAAAPSPPSTGVAAPPGRAGAAPAGSRAPATAAVSAADAAGSVPQPATPAGQDDLLDRVRVGWPAIVAALSRTPLVKPLAEACRPVRLDGHVVVLGFPEDKAFMREKAEQRHVAFEDAIAAVVGTTVGVRCVATNLELLPPLPHEAIGRDNLDAARRIFAGDLADAVDVE